METANPLPTPDTRHPTPEPSQPTPDTRHPTPDLRAPTGGFWPALAFALLLLALGGAALGLGAWRLAQALPVSTLECSRADGLCRLEDSGLLAAQSRQFGVHELAGVQLRVYPAGRRSSRYQILLQVGGKPVELGEPAFGEHEHEALAAQVQAFVDDPLRPQLLLRRDARRQVYGSSAMGVVAGLLMLLLAAGLLVTARRARLARKAQASGRSR